MLDSRTRAAVARLVTAVLSVKPLLDGIAAPVRVMPVAGDPAAPAARGPALDEVLRRVTRAAGVEGLALSPGLAAGDLQVFERVISDRLALAELPDSLAALPDELLDEVEEVAAAAVADGFDAYFHKETIRSPDGVPLTVYGAGQGETVVLIPACGMPAALTESWMRYLARDRRVLAWETRGLFDAADHHGDFAVDLATQAADLFTVLDHHGVASAHVIGLCGGAVMALAAAAAQPGRISSLSLWHGAYEFASGSPRTRFQNDLIELMALAARSRAAARSVQTAFCQVALTSTPAQVAHFVLYPYTGPELFYRYCRLNDSLARTDVGQYLTKVKQPTLVVTSLDDETAHPEGSRQVAGGLPNARLWMMPHGDHASLFHADDSLLRVAVDFIAEAVADSPAAPAPEDSRTE
ncbi:alpha/beta fold hydrolase [Phytohabitans kaempferiae]|uniref:Alpha/beta fold hydrolase n=1 Tax=Phytohabitans kaempferiae TaxID=1620943 RepID=A0ABV6LYT5_9ACTN